MNRNPVNSPYLSFSRLKLFFALSRTPHGVLDMATPAFAALLWLGGFPSLRVVVLGLITAFAGYTAVYALNDVIDFRVDREKIKQGGFKDSGDYLDAAMVRHPMAQGLLSFREGLVWAVAWSGVAMAGAYLLNPVCVLIFLAGCGLEAFYCVMLKISPLRTLVSGAVKTSGPVAAVFAVDPSPSPTFVLTLFLCLFFWEIGGQNVPADWTDMEEDRQFRSRTIPVRFGPGGSSVIILGALLLAVILSVLIFEFTATGFHLLYRAAFFAVGTYLLLIPAYRLHRQKQRGNAMALFNRASYYPPALLLVVMAKGLL